MSEQVGAEAGSVEVGSVSSDLNTVLHKHSITVDDLIRCGKGGLEATRARYDRDGDLVEEIPDWNVRHKFFSSFLELLGLVKQGGVVVNVGKTEEEKRIEEGFAEWKRQQTGLSPGSSQ